MPRSNEDILLDINSGTGDRRELLGELYANNTRLILRLVRRYKHIEDLEDLLQEAFFGIARAAELWDPSRKVKFNSYAGYWIQQAVRSYVDACGGVVRVPSYRRDQIALYHKEVNMYRQTFAQYPTKKEICTLLNMTPQEVESLEKDIQALRIRSTSEPVGEDGTETLEDFLPDESGDPYEDVLDRMEQEQLAETIRTEVDSLEPQLRDAIRARYMDERTFEECGAVLGITKGQARAAVSKGLRALRSGDHLRRLRPFITRAGAYTYGIHNTSFGTFTRYGSSQELAVISLEQQAGMKLCGTELDLSPVES